MKKIAIFLFAAFFWSAPAMSLTIVDALNSATQNSDRVKQSRSLVGAQGEKVKAEKSEFLPSLDLGYTFVRQEEEIFFTTKNTSSFSVEGSYNLFNGFVDTKSLEKEEHLLLAERYQEEAVVEDVILEAKRAFFDVLRARSNLDAAKEGVELLQRQLRDSELRFKEGLIAKNDLLKVSVELATAEQQRLQAESNLKVGRKRLERVIGKQLGADEILEEPSSPEEVKISIEELRKEMFERRSELRYLKALLESETAEKAAIRGDFLPSVDLILRFRRAGDGIMPDGREGLFIIDTELSGTVAATWNIFDGYRTTHEVAEQQQIINARMNEIRDFEKEIGFQLEASIENHRVSLGKLAVAKKSVAQAEENYRITDNQFKAGINTVTDLLDARLFLTRARVQFNIAYYDVMTSVADLERVVEMKLYIPLPQ